MLIGSLPCVMSQRAKGTMSREDQELPKATTTSKWNPEENSRELQSTADFPVPRGTPLPCGTVWGFPFGCLRSRAAELVQHRLVPVEGNCGKRLIILMACQPNSQILLFCHPLLTFSVNRVFIEQKLAKPSQKKV